MLCRDGIITLKAHPMKVKSKGNDVLYGHKLKYMPLNNLTLKKIIFIQKLVPTIRWSASNFFFKYCYKHISIWYNMKKYPDANGWNPKNSIFLNFDTMIRWISKVMSAIDFLKSNFAVYFKSFEWIFLNQNIFVNINFFCIIGIK